MPLLTRRRFLTTLAATTVLGPGPAQAAASRELKIVVDRGGWRSARPEDIQAVLLSAGNELWRFCGAQRIPTIRVYHRDNFPQTDFLHDWRGRVRIGLASEDTRWAQMSFQFGHELCHTLAQHSDAAKGCWKPPKHSNLWFEESLCEASSLFVLRRLTPVWQAVAPYPSWREYAPSFSEYAAERLSRPAHQLPAGQTFAAWFRENEKSLRENAMQREKNVIVARQLLPIMEAEPNGWEAACYLNLGAKQEDKPLMQYFTEWQNACPPGLKPAVKRIATLFPSGGLRANGLSGVFATPAPSV